MVGARKQFCPANLRIVVKSAIEYHGCLVLYGGRVFGISFHLRSVLFTRGHRVWRSRRAFFRHIHGFRRGREIGRIRAGGNKAALMLLAYRHPITSFTCMSCILTYMFHPIRGIPWPHSQRCYGDYPGRRLVRGDGESYLEPSM